MDSTEILVLFDKNGRKINGAMADFNYKTDAERQALIDDGYIAVSPEDFDLYCDCIGGKNENGYIRDPKTGKPIDAPARVCTKEEKATILFNECQTDINAINSEIVIATADDDSELLDELRQEKHERIKEYEQALISLGDE